MLCLLSCVERTQALSYTFRSGSGGGRQNSQAWLASVSLLTSVSITVWPLGEDANLSVADGALPTYREWQRGRYLTQNTGLSETIFKICFGCNQRQTAEVTCPPRFACPKASLLVTVVREKGSPEADRGALTLLPSNVCCLSSTLRRQKISLDCPDELQNPQIVR